MSIHQPHDSIFRDIISEPKYAAQIFQETLPEQIINSIDLKTLCLEPDSFIDENMKDYQSDGLFSVRTLEENHLQIYILFEHKSWPDKKIHYQILAYLARIYERQKIPVPVIPFVFYHGKDPWNIKNNFMDIFSLSEKQKSLLQKYIPEYGEFIMTTAETLIEKGIQKGKLEGKLEDARKLKELGIDIGIIVKATGLTPKILKENGII